MVLQVLLLLLMPGWWLLLVAAAAVACLMMMMTEVFFLFLSLGTTHLLLLIAYPATAQGSRLSGMLPVAACDLLPSLMPCQGAGYDDLMLEEHQEQQRAVLTEMVEFLCSSALPVPAEALSIIRKMARDSPKYPATLSGKDASAAARGALSTLHQLGALSLEEVAVGPQKVLMVVATNAAVLRGLQGECDRPSGQMTLALHAGCLETPSSNQAAPKEGFREACSTAEDGGNLTRLLSRPTLLESATAQSFRKEGSGVLLSLCEHRTRENCLQERPASAGYPPCPHVHFKRRILPHTDVSLGDCSYLKSCRRPLSCKYVHYEIEEENADITSPSPELASETQSPSDGHKPESEAAAHLPDAATALVLHDELQHSLQPLKQLPAQWVNVDVRSFDLCVLGEFDVVLMDPPWNIRMQLPYGTMSDDEIRALPLHHLGSEGLLFLWVTGRCVELGKELLVTWGYKQVEEIVWVKTNQLSTINRGGRTGYWLNHSKEHCLVAIKGNPRLHRGYDCDVIVSEVRETSRKPEELYELIERMSPGTRKIELFGRSHNRRPGWMTVGNQLEGTHLVEPEVIERFERRYPELAHTLLP